MSILSKLLTKRGITREELSTEEKEEFNQWEKILKKEELTIGDLKNFMGQQVDLIDTKWRDYGLSDKKKAELIPYHTVYKVLLGAISAPQQERSQLIQYITNLIKQ